VAILALLGCYLFYDPHSDSFAKAGLLCIAIGSIVPQFDDLTNNLGRFMTHGIAKYSYGLYLFHYPLLWWFYRYLDMGNTSRFAGYILSLAAMSFFSYHLLENPLIRFGKHLSGATADQPRTTASLPARSPA
jgi:peptidoglycan/LPS O-acetylase OafA/YrhL